MKLELTKEELTNAKLSPETLQDAIDQIKLDGYVLFENVLPQSLISELQSTYKAIFEEHVNKVGVDTQDVNEETKRGKNRFLMFLPFEKPFNDANIIANQIVLQVMDAMLGKDYVCSYFASDTPLPGSDYQGVHSDDAALFPESDLVLPPAALVVNIPVVDTTELNGPMDIWPGGSHRMPENLNRPKRIQEVAARMNPTKVLMPAGSILIRDLRMWHRGTPNISDAARPNIAIIYSRPWYTRDHNSPKISIPQETYAQLPETTKRLFRLANIGG